MKRALLIGGGIVGVIAVGLIVASIFFFASLEPFIKQAIETYGSRMTQAKVTLDEVELDTTSGRGTLRGLTIGNPKGFSTPSAVELGAISVAIDAGTLTSDTIVIREIVLERPKVTLEFSGAGHNLGAIQRNVDAYLARFGGDDARQDGERTLIVENLYVRDGTVTVSAAALKGEGLSTSMPDIHLTDIGKDSGGATAGQLADRLWTAMRDSATRAASDLDIETMLDRLNEGAGEAGKALKSLLGGD